MAIIVLFQCYPWCLPTQNWLKNATNDISIQEFHNITRHYVKDTDTFYGKVYFTEFVQNSKSLDMGMIFLTSDLMKTVRGQKHPSEAKKGMEELIH